jgi:hypothetical protein
MCQVLALLRQAEACARQLSEDARQFALGVSRLIDVANITELRSLLHQGYVACLLETTRPADESRTFVPVRNLSLPDAACLLLTPAGLALANELAHRGRAARGPRPHYDADTRELRLGDDLVKSYTKAAPNQKLVILSFQEQRWRRRIDDPLPGRPDLDRKERLRRTIADLNDHQLLARIHFHADGTGTGVCWRLTGQAVG